MKLRMSATLTSATLLLWLVACGGEDSTTAGPGPTTGGNGGSAGASSGGKGGASTGGKGGASTGGKGGAASSAGATGTAGAGTTGGATGGGGDPANPCVPNPCNLLDQVCVPDGSAQGYQCECIGDCGSDPCAGITCNGHGTCFFGACSCSGDWSGADCSTCGRPCASDEARYRDRFLFCTSDGKTVEYCTGWMGCSGDININATYGTVTGPAGSCP